MHKKKIALVVVALVVIIGIVVVFFSNMQKEKVAKNPKNNVENIEDVYGGIDDSIFDDVTETKDATEYKKTEAASESDGSESTTQDAVRKKKNEQTTKSAGQKNKEQTTKSSEKKNNVTDSNNGSKDDEKTPSKTPTASVQHDYESFHAMSPSEQQKYMESFKDIDAFFEWYNAEKEEYEKKNPSIEIDGGAIDLDKIAN